MLPMSPITTVVAADSTVSLSAAATTFQDPDDIIRRVEVKLNSFQSLSGDFLQLGPDGRISEGKFVLKRPGKIRFEYTTGEPLLVVSDGHMLTFVDYDVSQVTRWPIKDTPLWVLVAQNISLTEGLRIGPIVREHGYVKVSVVDPQREEQGSITLVFEQGALNLRAWEVIDAQGLQTRVTIMNPVYDGDVDKARFDFEDPRPGMNVKHGPRRF